MSETKDLESSDTVTKPEIDVTVDSIQDESAKQRTWKQKIAGVVWDSLDKTPEERRFIAKVDWWILSYCCIAYFVKYLGAYTDEQSCRSTTCFAHAVSPSPTHILVWDIC